MCNLKAYKSGKNKKCHKMQNCHSNSACLKHPTKVSTKSMAINSKCNYSELEMKIFQFQFFMRHNGWFVLERCPTVKSFMIDGTLIKNKLFHSYASLPVSEAAHSLCPGCLSLYFSCCSLIEFFRVITHLNIQRVILSQLGMWECTHSSQFWEKRITLSQVILILWFCFSQWLLIVLRRVE